MGPGPLPRVNTELFTSFLQEWSFRFEVVPQMQTPYQYRHGGESASDQIPCDCRLPTILKILESCPASHPTVVHHSSHIRDKFSYIRQVTNPRAILLWIGICTMPHVCERPSHVRALCSRDASNNDHHHHPPDNFTPSSQVPTF